MQLAHKTSALPAQMRTKRPYKIARAGPPRGYLLAFVAIGACRLQDALYRAPGAVSGQAAVRAIMIAASARRLQATATNCRISQPLDPHGRAHIKYDCLTQLALKNPHPHLSGIAHSESLIGGRKSCSANPNADTCRRTTNSASSWRRLARSLSTCKGAGGKGGKGSTRFHIYHSAALLASLFNSNDDTFSALMRDWAAHSTMCVRICAAWHSALQ
jgi:hypothetical protein